MHVVIHKALLIVRPAWVITWWWKSTTGFAVGTVS